MFVLHHGDCLDVLRGMAENSVDSIVTDPPAGIGFMGRAWDSDKGGRERWVAWMQEIASECLRVIKPGGHALVWAIPRTSHWTATAWERGGWQVRDRIAHVFSGFPKSHNGPWGGTALKPAMEDWWLLRKPLVGTVAANHAEHGTGGLNIEGCRVEGAPELRGRDAPGNVPNGNGVTHGSMERAPYSVPTGRWPANMIHSGEDEVVALFPHSSGSAARFFYAAKASKRDREEGLEGFAERRGGSETFDPAARQGVGDDRMPVRRNVHPTVKPTDLMRYLCRLVTPPGGVVLDPFAGSGSTGKAAMLEGFDFIGIEREAEYIEIARARIAHAASQRDAEAAEPSQSGLFEEEV